MLVKVKRTQTESLIFEDFIADKNQDIYAYDRLVAEPTDNHQKLDSRTTSSLYMHYDWLFDQS